MEYDYRRFQNAPPYGFPAAAHYMNERNAPLSLSHLSRADPRTCPMGGLGGGMRTGMRPSLMREDEMPDHGGNARRRIAIACARCRKRKIRCSGDPGNGTGCTNCKSAGVDISMCQFNRVGSVNAEYACTAAVLSGFSNGLPNMGSPNTPIPLYSANASASYHRSLPTTLYTPQLDTKPAVYPQTWTVPGSEDTSPVETYNLDQSTAYMPSVNTMTQMYGQAYRQNQSNQRSTWTATNSYLDYDGSTSYPTHGLPLLQTSNLRSPTKPEALSPLNMTSIQSALPMTLPERPHPDAVARRPQLPRPQPRSTQRTAHNVDLQQDQRLRSAQMMSGTSMGLNTAFAKPAINWSSDTSGSEDVKFTPPSDTSSVDVSTQNTTSASANNDASLGYVPVSTTCSENSLTATSQPQLNFSTSTLLDVMPSPASTATYSNFRNYALPTSTSTDSFSVLARQNSQPSLYSFSSDSTVKRNSFSSAGSASNQAALVSGQRYTPLNQSSQAHQAANVDNRHMTVHRASMSNLNRSF